ncbi:MAG: cytochrome-c peroxidase, partial [Pirellulales bacterium]
MPSQPRCRFSILFASISLLPSFFCVGLLLGPSARGAPDTEAIDTGKSDTDGPQLAALCVQASIIDPATASLGKRLFFDPRLSGDATISCATCHQPEQAWTDGQALSQGYPGTLYFRNVPTLLGASHNRYFYWDGRLSGDDLPTLVRDHISEAHFMQADGRLVIERMRQIPVYQNEFREVFDGEPTYGRILNAVA